MPGRERPLPLLSVTEEDARLHGTTPERLADRWRGLLEQRYRSLLVALRRLANLLAIAVGGAWIVAGIPLLSELSANALLAGGAVLGALALVFQGMLRDFIAGLVALVDDRYAIGDQVEASGLMGEVLDVGVLSTELRSVDQRVMVGPNSSCDQIVNHTKLRSGAEVTSLLLEPPVLRGIKAARPEGLEVSMLLVTRVGRQGEAQRELLRRLLHRLLREGIPLGGRE